MSKIYQTLLGATIVTLLAILPVSADTKEECVDMRQTAVFLVHFAAENLKASVLFIDNHSIERSLQTFNKIPWVHSAHVFDEEKKLLARYSDENTEHADEAAIAALKANTPDTSFVIQELTVENEQGNISTIGYLVLALKQD